MPPRSSSSSKASYNEEEEYPLQKPRKLKRVYVFKFIDVQGPDEEDKTIVDAYYKSDKKMQAAIRDTIFHCLKEEAREWKKDNKGESDSKNPFIKKMKRFDSLSTHDLIAFLDENVLLPQSYGPRFYFETSNHPLL